MNKLVHVHASKQERGVNVFLIMLPIIAFAAMLMIYYVGFSNNETLKSRNEETLILGDEDISIDN